MIYLGGSLANPRIPEIEQLLRASGFDVFAEWYGAGEKADESWQAYFKSQGVSLRDALASDFCQNGFLFDKRHIDKADTFILVAPLGKSGMLELGYALGKGKRGYVFFPNGDPERYDLMLAFATGIFYTLEELKQQLVQDRMENHT